MLRVFVFLLFLNLYSTTEDDEYVPTEHEAKLGKDCWLKGRIYYRKNKLPRTIARTKCEKNCDETHEQRLAIEKKYNHCLDLFSANIVEEFVSQVTYQETSKYKESRKYMRKNPLRNDFLFIVCGHAAPKNSGLFRPECSKEPSFPEGVDAFNEYMETESYHYVEVVDKRFEVLKSSTLESMGIWMTIRLRSVSSFIMTRKVYINALQVKPYIWRIRKIELSGACVNTDKFDKELVISTWEQKISGDQVQPKPKEFMETVLRWIPFSFTMDKRRLRLFMNVGSVDQPLADTTKFFRYMQQFSRWFTTRNNLNAISIRDNEDCNEIKAETKIIMEADDHMVFQTSVAFENKRNRSIQEMWNFQIEITYNNNMWKVTHLFCAPTITRFRKNDRYKQFFLDYADDTIEEIEQIGRAENHSNWHEFWLVDRFRNTIQRENRYLINTPLVAHARLMHYFTPKLAKFNHCIKTFNEITLSNILIKCHYYFNSKNGLIHEKIVQLDICGSVDKNNGGIKVDYITFLQPITVMSLNEKDENYSEEKIEFAEKISLLFIGQTSEEYNAWEHNALELMNNMNHQNIFEYKICKTTKPISSLRLFKKHLDRRRRNFKVMEMDSILVITDWWPFFRFRVQCTFTNKMNYLVTESYIFTTNRDENDQLKVQYVYNEDACFYTNQFQNYTITSIGSTDHSLAGNVTAKQFMDTISNSLPYIQNNGLIEKDNYSPNFEAIIEANPNNSETYTFREFKTYMRRFTGSNKLRENFYKKNQDKKANRTVIVEEADHFVIKLTMMFDYFTDGQTSASVNKWTFMIEAAYVNEVKHWNIKKLIMTPPANLLEKDIIQNRASLKHMINVERNSHVAVSEIVRMFYESSSEVTSLKQCKPIEYDSSDSQIESFNKQFLGYLTEEDVTGPIFTKKGYDVFNIDSFTFNITYFYNFMSKGINVSHYAKYNYKYDYYYDTGLKLFCPHQEGYYYTPSLFPMDGN